MANTGAPWNIPYVEPTDLVRNYPAAAEDLADAIADGLDAAGGLVAVKSAIFTGVQTNSTATGANFAVTDLTITHEVADVANKLIISAFVGVLGTSAGGGQAGIAVHDGTSLIAIGATAGSRTRVTAGGRNTSTPNDSTVSMPAVTFVHTPGTGSKTYTLRAINATTITQTLTINQPNFDPDGAQTSRGVSSLVIQEVKV